MRRLLWRLFPTYLVFIVICTAAIGLYAWHATRKFFVNQTESHLRIQAGLVLPQIQKLPTTQPVALEATVRRIAAGCDCRVTLIAADGSVLAESHRDSESMLNHSNRPEFRQAMSGQSGAALRHSGTLNEEMLYVTEPVKSDEGRIAGVLRLAKPVTQIDHELGTIYLRLAIAAAVVIGLAGLLALLLSRALTRPLEKIRHGAERFARGELSHRLYVPRTEEMGAVAESLNQMAGQLDEKIKTITGQKAQQDTILASMDEGVAAVDSAGRLTSLNAAAARLLRAQAIGDANGGGDGLLGRPLAEVIRYAPLDRLVKSVLSGGGPAEVELNLGSDREAGFIQVRASSLRDPAGQNLGALLVFNDVTRLRRLERVRQDFVANVSHELKTPITSIKGFIETLRDGSVEPAKARRFLEIIATQSDRLHAIIEDLLTLSRLEQGSEKAEIRMEPAAVRPVLEHAAEVCQLAAESRGIAVRIDCPPTLSARMNGLLLEQAVVNLLDNAIKYSEANKEVAVSAEPAENASAVKIRVIDHGSGIPREHLGRIFERFYRVDKARSRTLGGTGLGLAIVKHIVNAHNGTVSVESEAGAGCTFTIKLPTR